MCIRDRDGDDDLFVGEVGGFKIDSRVTVLENLSTDTSVVFEHRIISGINDDFVVAVPSAVDFDDDGKPDLIVSDFDGKVACYKNHGGFNFQFLTSTTFGLTQFSSMASFEKLSEQNKLLAFSFETGFQMFEDRVSEELKFVPIGMDSTFLINPDSTNARFFQIRSKDMDRDNREDVFLSSLSLNASRGYQTESWYLKKQGFGVSDYAISPNCFEGNDGKLELRMLGGIGPFEFEWTNVETDETGNGVFQEDVGVIENLSGGVYAIRITSADGAVLDFSSQIDDPDQIVVGVDIDNLKCFGDCNAQIDVSSSSGGTGLLGYHWEGYSVDTLSLIHI